MPKSRMQKREEAEARQAAADARTPNEQMALVMRRPGASEHEVAKLTERIENGGAHTAKSAVTEGHKEANVATGSAGAAPCPTCGGSMVRTTSGRMICGHDCPTWLAAKTEEHT